MADQHSLTEDYETPYKFNGKELDSETGLYYYGARYYDPRTSIWLSADPLMEKYPNVNPYAYCLQNPIMYTDPTGMSVEGDGDGKPGFFAKAWGTVKGWFSSGSEYKPIPQSSQSTIEFGEPSTYAIPDESWTDGTSIYNRASPSVLEIYNLSTSETTYGLSLPQDFGTWGQEGSDGQIWIGCMSCHAENGAYRHIAYNSKEHKIGLIGAMILQALLPIPTPSALTATEGGLVPLGLGSTGRTTAANLTEQLAMREAMSNPAAGSVVMRGMKDSRWLGWDKMQYIHTGLDGSKNVIHYVGKFEKGVLKAVDDFKFK